MWCSVGYMINWFVEIFSLYLCVYVDNFVDWYLWGEEVFVEVQWCDVFLLILIGYFICYWCYVMVWELFVDLVMVVLINDGFVVVKVDCEEYFQVDGVYMVVVLVFMQNFGWLFIVFIIFWGCIFYVGIYWLFEVCVLMFVFCDVFVVVCEVWMQCCVQVEEFVDVVIEVFVCVVEILFFDFFDFVVIVVVVMVIVQWEDWQFGGFGVVLKFLVVMMLWFLQYLLVCEGVLDVVVVVGCVFVVMVDLDLCDVDGGFFWYVIQCDWMVLYYEWMLIDNVQFFDVVCDMGDEQVVWGIVVFLVGVF